MAIIDSYPLGNINRKSKLLGTESPGQETSNFTMSSIEDFIIGVKGDRKIPVISQLDFTTSEPTAFVEGNRYINTVTGVGSASGTAVVANSIYEARSSAWTEITPVAGFTVWDIAQSKNLTFDGSAWIGDYVSEAQLDLKADKATTYTETETDNLLALKADQATTYTQTQVDAALAIKADLIPTNQAIAALEAGQTGGLLSFTTLALLQAYATPTTTDSYKVTNDSPSSNNGFYHYTGSAFVKDASLVQNTIDPANTSEGVSGQAVSEFTNTEVSAISDFSSEFVQSNNIDPTNGQIVANAAGAFKTLLAKPLAGVTQIELDARTYNAGQPTILYYTLTDFDTYTFLSSARYTAATVLTPSDFPSGATHFMAQGIIALLSPVCKVYKSFGSGVTDNATEIDALNSFNDNDAGFYNIALFDQSSYTQGIGVDSRSGRTKSGGSATQQLSDYAEVRQGDYISQFIISAYGYEANGDFVGQITLTNSGAFTVSNPLIKKVRCVFPSTAQNVWLDGFQIYGFNGATSYYPYRAEKEFLQPKKVTRYIQGFGDSLIGRGGSFTKLAEVTGHPAAYLTYGGMVSSFIRDKFITHGNKSNAINIFWVGQNNTDEPDTIVEDLKKMVRSLTHNRFLIATTILGANTTEAINAEKKLQNEVLTKKIKSIWGNHVVETLPALVEGGYDMGGAQLKNAFVQPSLNGSVTIDVTDAQFFQFVNPQDSGKSYIPDQDKISIGFNGVYDKYTVTGSLIDPGGDGKEGTLTIRLDTVGRIAVGNSVDNISVTATPAGGSTPSTFIKYLQLWKDADIYCNSVGILPTSAREDSIHPSNYGGAAIGEIFGQAIKTLGFDE